MRDSEVKTAGLEISGDAEVMEITKATGDALSHLENAVNGFDGGISQAGVEIGQDAGEVLFERAGEFAEGFEPGTVGPAQPPADRRQVAIGQHSLEGLTQGESAAEDWVGAGQLAAQVELLLGARPFVASQRPESAGQISSLLAQALANSGPWPN